MATRVFNKPQWFQLKTPKKVKNLWDFPMISTLTKLHNKLDNLENKIEVLNTESVLLKAGVETKTNTESLKQEIALLKENLANDRTSYSREIKNLKSQIENSRMKRNSEVNALLSSVSSNLNGLKRTQNIIQNNISSQAAAISGVISNNSKMTSALFERNPEAFLDFLPSPRNGKSFNGSTFEAISAAVPTDNMLVAQIKNYMDVDLTGYQLYLDEGFVAAPAPNKIFAKTAEVATFESNNKLNFAAEPEMSYRIGDTDISLHLYFIYGGKVQTFAAALLPRSAPAKSIISFDCTQYNHSGTAGSHKCVTNVGFNSTRTLTVYEGDIFLKVTFETTSYPRPGVLTFVSVVLHQKYTFSI
ncbi:unnamed protein product [Allacma fusca]|uniref:Uncharacterized protein n=1 Tax=Allacma fusca TaxID=39272 RepID=A0A8J2LEK9_9HEXA|nr:unnamed protein product [Allacma fusca]